MIKIKNLTKVYRKGEQNFVALNDITLNIEKGSFMSVTGHSGSGKSTLLNAIGGLVHPDSGSVYFNGKDIYSAGTKELNQYRKEKVGFVFQQFHLVPYLSVAENILMSCREKSHAGKLNRLLEECALSAQKDKYPSELSVGEKQRAAFIRAIISGPELLLADEPTGNLDPENSTILLNMIKEFNSNGGTVILVSHDPAVSSFAAKTVRLEKGKII
ncbi:MAG TPA: ABC transporter ATP-binding protein [Bacteroidales bacterium]|nr:ABC transporter ATP-binding protein [Bacteroidales bacterium]